MRERQDQDERMSRSTGMCESDQARIIGSTVGGPSGPIHSRLKPPLRLISETLRCVGADFLLQPMTKAPAGLFKIEIRL